MMWRRGIAHAISVFPDPELFRPSSLILLSWTFEAGALPSLRPRLLHHNRSGEQTHRDGITRTTRVVVRASQCPESAPLMCR